MCDCRGALIVLLTPSRYYAVDDMATSGLGIHKDAVSLYFTLNNEMSSNWARVERQGKEFNVYLLRGTKTRNSSIENIPVETLRENEYQIKLPLDPNDELPVSIAVNGEHVGAISPLKK